MDVAAGVLAWAHHKGEETNYKGRPSRVSEGNTHRLTISRPVTILNAKELRAAKKGNRLTQKKIQRLPTMRVQHEYSQEMELAYVFKGRDDEHRVCTLSKDAWASFSSMQLTPDEIAARAKRRAPWSIAFRP